MKTEYGSTDAAANSCVLLYDFFGNSYAGEPTVNLFTQPTGNAGFSIKPVNTGRAFWKLDYTEDLNGQGNFLSNASGSYLPTDSIYKYNFVSTQTDSTSNKHGFTIKVDRGETYTASVDVFVSSSHPRTGVVPILSMTPNSTASYAILTGSYDLSKKGNWQNVREKIFIPKVTNIYGSNPIYYEVSVKQKTVQHPYYGSGSSDGFVIGNTEGKTLYLYRGATYVFSQSNSSNVSDEIYLTTTASSGGGSNSYSNGFSYFGNEGFDGYGVFTVPYNAPSILFYNSKRASSSYFGGKINILGSYNSGNIGNTGNGGNGGNTGNTGNVSVTTTESYQVCFDPTRNELTPANLNGGYILYKNMQVEKNKPMFKGVIHSTKFTSSARSAYSSFIDLTGNGFDSNLINGMFDDQSYLVFGNRPNLQDGGLVDINLKYNRSKNFAIGSSSTQTYDFWFTQTRSSYGKAFLFSRSNAVVGDYFLENQGYPQLIYIQDKRIYFSFTSATNEIFSGYTQQAIDLNRLYNVNISFNVSLSLGFKADIYINGIKADIFVIDILQPPTTFSFSSVVSSSGNLGASGNVGFQSNNTNFYCVSSYNANGESRPSSVISAAADPVKKSTKLSWSLTENATGYYIYRSSSPIFSKYSLLADINSKNISTYTDENFQLRQGFPKLAGLFNSNYNANITTLVDSQTARVCVGNYPISSLNLNHFEGYVYRFGIYKIKMTEEQIIRNYNSFLYKYISQDPNVIGSYAKQRSVIYKRIKQ